jgi:hypothetical protein
VFYFKLCSFVLWDESECLCTLAMSEMSRDDNMDRLFLCLFFGKTITQESFLCNFFDFSSEFKFTHVFIPMHVIIVLFQYNMYYMRNFHTI